MMSKSEQTFSQQTLTSADVSSAVQPMTDENPLVSVILIFFNGERFLEEAIASVATQTYDNWELLLIDDGSNDASSTIANQYCDAYPGKMRYLAHPHRQNLGMSASRNLGIMEARAELLAFIDSDDVWLPKKLEEQVGILQSHPNAAMVYGQIEYWYSWTGDPDDLNRDYLAGSGSAFDSIVEPPHLVRDLLERPVATVTGALVRRSQVQTVGGFDEAFRGLFEDQVFHSKICLHSPVYVSSKCWYRYRKHSNSCCSRAEEQGEYHSNRIKYLNWLEDYARQQRIEDSSLSSDLNRELWKAHFPSTSALVGNARHRSLKTMEAAKSIIRRFLPAPLYGWLRRKKAGPEAPIEPGFVRFGDLRRLTPLSRTFGFDRGAPVDRHYIESFLAAHSVDIRGRVLEVGDNAYTFRFGEDRVLRSDVLHVSEDSPKATIVADLTQADHIESSCFDCIVLTQTLHLIYDVRAALQTLHRILKPGGVLLVTVPGISQIDHYEWRKSWYWSFTKLSISRLFAEVFRRENIEIVSHGNVLTALAFLHGLAAGELKHSELEFNDDDYQVLITVRATKEK